MSTKIKKEKSCLKRRQKVFVALSGGVDSSVAAALLVRSGDVSVVGAHMKCWSEGEYCTSEQDATDARRVAEKLNIPFYVFDLEKEYRKSVYDYMVREYAEGLTPNPDVMCNKEIKFGVFLKKALSLGADYIATGHYIKMQNAKIKNPKQLHAAYCTLLTAYDGAKDQSYFLWMLTQKQLKHSLFPLGDYTKDEVRRMARAFGLPTHAKKDSQGLCFVGNIDFRSFMQNALPKQEGKVLTVAGKEIGTHDGAAFYTIGQRHGLGLGGGIPYYVTEKNIKTNTLTVAKGPYDETLFKKEIVLRDVHWISGHAPKLSLKCEARIRYRQPLQKAKIISSAMLKTGKQEKRIKIEFEEPQRAVTPGQSVVFYKNSHMLGGGIIV